MTKIHLSDPKRVALGFALGQKILESQITAPNPTKSGQGGFAGPWDQAPTWDVAPVPRESPEATSMHRGEGFDALLGVCPT